MKGILQVTIICAVSGLLTNCIHMQPLTQSEVYRLTTCPDTNLEKIRKSLILSGYEIKSRSDTDLVTEFKQVGGYGGYRSFRRISVVKEDPKKYRFVVREKTIELESERPQQAYTNPTNATPVVQATVVNVNLGNQQPRQLENEFEPNYVESTLEVHETIKSQVCGK
jgi:hypothetical protein